ncbi:leucine-rich repeat-containing protein 24 [Toxorhynchites rutilus septentrionalis]|uniref:leucine-rich repeat-containing protein 24 n=1 Tax=Toxorhynchites rutilus septentrionalis TaxID=329112 RepID=UPI00247AF4FF|nr:leucine-rich repeat-containing protein 24 [Toxorhynchites rutilus septentrionalis]XP_055635383.1 leucine-rich repeat-containing protein 24 [Toxorhynchites rutilus septentrionalis]XP_055635474.1 leucine-rich repeat-containing protein 24 [Toxorhynchites rutilus septentrionalis]XP_055635543.1 leucine-rich repeat-containing protein 24 [Toxorhynchites rutilus septentrionalis]XP_055635632.1 leucine-rich repeat-containing protein 24 [Toxorhynchites rutilus septentrionalis]XP_055635716.1 leucine-ri
MDDYHQRCQRGRWRSAAAAVVFPSLWTTGLIVTTLLMLLLAGSTGAETEKDFTQQCNKCRCSWKSGKRNADCTSLGLEFIPNDLSSELQLLDLSNNRIGEIRAHELMHGNQQNLHKLYIKNSTIESLHRDAFRNLLILIELDLSMNKVKRLDPGLFDDLLKLRVLILNHNQIERIENNLFQNLVYLTKVELRDNSIYRIAQHSFNNVPMLSQIELDFNELRILRRETFINLEKLASLSLTNNPWNCSCALRNFSEFIMTRSLYRNPTTCADPPLLAGKGWNDIHLDEFACRPQIIENRIIYPGDGENATITCRVIGQPLPKVDWLFHKRPFPKNDKRLSVTYAVRTNGKDSNEILVSELTIVGVKPSDRGAYVCKATNTGGTDESEQFFDLKKEPAKIPPNRTNDILWIVLFVVLAILLILILTIVILCCVCRKARRFKKNSSISENGLMNSKMDKSTDGSVLDGGSVIMEMQKSLLTEVNPVEKPPRRADIEANEKVDYDEGHEVKKTLLEETGFATQDEETASVALSDTTPRSRAAYVEDGYGATLPPDLLAFPSTRFPQSPSIQSSMSNIHDGRIYGKSPLSSPIYQHSPGILGASASGQVPAGFRTLQHPKTGRTIAIAAQRANSPFTPAPLIYPQVVMKQGYVTIPRKPRTPSWTPSVTSTATTAELLPPTSPTSTGELLAAAEPVYDNLGLRTTASGNSTLKLNKSAKAGPSSNSTYSMKNRPLPATPGGQIATGAAAANSTSNYESIPEAGGGTGGGQSALLAKAMAANTSTLSGLESIYGRTTGPNSSILSNGSNSSSSRSKVPPRPPPKPKKKPSIASGPTGSSALVNTSSTSPLFADEGEDGTEV